MQDFQIQPFDFSATQATIVANSEKGKAEFARRYGDSCISINVRIAGIRLLIIRRGNGMLATGKIKPERRIVGSRSPASEIIMATCCELVMVEMKMPSESAVTIKSSDSSMSSSTLPLQGTPKTNEASATTVTTFTKESKK